MTTLPAVPAPPAGTRSEILAPGYRCASPHVASRRLASLRRLVGETPLLEVHARFRGRPAVVHAKYEVQGFTGSIKDRMALQILESALAEGRLVPGATIAEATSGNTGIAFAAIGRALGHPVRIYMPDWMSRERVLLIQSLGATVVPVSSEEGGFRGSVEQAERFAAEHRGEHVFLPRQFESAANVDAHYRTTGPEVLRQVAELGLRPTAFVAGVGTGGTVMGVGRFLRDTLGDAVTVHPLEPADSPTLSTGCKVGRHRIQGISDEFVPPIVALGELDRIVAVHDGDAILMAQALAARLGLGVGISSGANFLGALEIAAEQGGDAVVTTVFPDSNKKYLTTDLCRPEPERPGYLTPEVELVSFVVHPGGWR